MVSLISSPGLRAKMLQLNMDKMEVLVLMNKSIRNLITINKIKIDSVDLASASSLRKPGSIFDSAQRLLWTVSAYLLVSINSTSTGTGGLQQQMLPKCLSKSRWCPRLTITTACCTASQINYWIVLGKFRAMLLVWFSGCINSAI